MLQYFRRIGWKRLLVMFIGNVIIGWGVSIFKLSGLGNDPFSGMNMAVSSVLGISYPLFQILVNLLLFLLEVLFGRNMIGIGTIVNATMLGYICSFCYQRYLAWNLVPSSLPLRILVVVLGVAVTGLGISLYQQSDAGIAPYDAMSLLLDRKLKRVPYFWCRILTDFCCALLCFLCGGIIGLGTLVCVFGFGPVVSFYNRSITSCILSG